MALAGGAQFCPFPLRAPTQLKQPRFVFLGNYNEPEVNKEGEKANACQFSSLPTKQVCASFRLDAILFFVMKVYVSLIR